MDVNVDCFLRQTSWFERGNHPVDESVPPIGVGIGGVKIFADVRGSMVDGILRRGTSTGLDRVGLSIREGEKLE